MKIDPVVEHMLLDFGSATVAGALLGAAEYLVSGGAFDWRLLAAGALTGAVAAARKYIQAHALPDPAVDNAKP